MILSTLSISSHDFTFDFPTMLHTIGDTVYFLTYKSMIVFLISPCETPYPQQSVMVSTLDYP